MIFFFWLQGRGTPLKDIPNGMSGLFADPMLLFVFVFICCVLFVCYFVTMLSKSSAATTKEWSRKRLG